MSIIALFFKKLFQNEAKAPEPALKRASFSAPDDLKTHVQQLLAQNEPIEALDLMAQKGINEGVLLKNQWESGLMAYQTKRIDFAEWSRVQARICYAILAYFSPEETAKPVEEQGKGPLVPDVPVTMSQRMAVAQLVVQHHTPEALAICKNWGASFMLTEKRYTEAKRLWTLGMLAQEEWAGVQKQVDEAILCFLEAHPVKEAE